MREFNHTIGFCDGRAEFAEDEGLLRNFNILLGAVVPVVQANADQLLGVVDGSLQIVGIRLQNVAVRSKRVLHSSENMATPENHQSNYVYMGRQGTKVCRLERHKLTKFAQIISLALNLMQTLFSQFAK